MSGPSREDLIARALGALPPAETAAVDAAMRSDPDARREYEAASAHLLLYDHVSGAPPPPSFDALAKRLDERAAPRASVRGRLYRLAAASVAVAAVVVAILWARKVQVDEPLPVHATAEDASAIRVTHGSREIALQDAREGTQVAARRAATIRLGPATISLDQGSRVSLDGEREVELMAGRAAFDVSHSSETDRPVVFSVRVTPSVDVEVRGTRFVLTLYTDRDASVPLDAAGHAPPLVLVEVAEGVVEANGLPVRAGERRLFDGGKPREIPSSSLAVSLAGPTKTPVAGDRVDVALVFENPSDTPAALPARDAVGLPWFVEVTDPSGGRIPYRITNEMLPGFDPKFATVPPRGRVSLPIRFTSSFPIPGAYRLRALVGPFSTTSSAAGSQSMGQDLILDVR